MFPFSMQDAWTGASIVQTASCCSVPINFLYTQRNYYTNNRLLFSNQHFDPLQKINQNMMRRASAVPAASNLSLMFSSHIFRRSCLPCLWKLSACKQSSSIGNSQTMLLQGIRPSPTGAGSWGKVHKCQAWYRLSEGYQHGCGALKLTLIGWLVNSRLLFLHRWSISFSFSHPSKG